jgi:hypothetical protein
MIAHIAAGAGTVTIASGAGVINSISINSGAPGDTMLLHDSPDTSGSLMGVIDAATPRSLAVGWPFLVGLAATISGGASIDVTIAYTPKTVFLP